jgi:hypothetical protein
MFQHQVIHQQLECGLFPGGTFDMGGDNSQAFKR